MSDLVDTRARLWEMGNVLRPGIKALCAQRNVSHMVEDFVHMGLIHAVERADRYDLDRGSLETWAKRVALNKARDELRRKGRDHHLKTRLRDGLDAATITQPSITLQELPTEVALIARLRLEGATWVQVGRELGVSGREARRRGGQARQVLEKVS